MLQFIGIPDSGMRRVSMASNTHPNIFTMQMLQRSFSQGGSLLFHFDDFDAAARSLLCVGSEFCLQSVPHCLGADLGVPDVAGREADRLAMCHRPPAVWLDPGFPPVLFNGVLL